MSRSFTFSLDSESGGSWIKREGLVSRMTLASILFFDDESGQEIFLPFSQVQDWWYTKQGDKQGMRLKDLEPDDEITVLIPKWLLRKEGLL
jgi:hypothetical protein